MRPILGCTMAMVFALTAAGADDKKDEKIDGKKLVGKWEQKDAKLIFEFTKDGKLNVAGDKFKIEGSYKLDGNKLTIQMKIGENESNNASTIAKLTDDVLEVEGEGKKSKETVNRVEVK